MIPSTIDNILNQSDEKPESRVMIGNYEIRIMNLRFSIKREDKYRVVTYYKFNDKRLDFKSGEKYGIVVPYPFSCSLDKLKNAMKMFETLALKDTFIAKERFSK